MYETQMMLLHNTASNSGKDREKIRVILPVLFADITNDRRKLPPCFRIKSETRFIYSFLFHYGRKLKKIPDQNNLYTTKRLRILLDFSANRINHRQSFGPKHRHFIDDQNASFMN